MKLTRSALLNLTGTSLLAGRYVAAQPSVQMNRRKIPSSGELLPVVGVGTWRTFDVGSKPEDRAPVAEVLRVLFEAGGSMIDTSPMYGAAEAVIGSLLAASGSRSKAFIADLEPERRATAVGVYNFVVGVMYLPASLFAGALWAVAPSAAFAASTVMSVAAIGMFLLMVPRQAPLA